MRHWKPFIKPPFRWLYNHLKETARRYKKPIRMTFQEFLTFTAIDTCSYCGSKVEWHPHSRENGKKVSSSYFLDRKDSSRGYTQSNCVVCCTLCNKIKSNNLTHEEMKLLGPTIAMILRQRNQTVSGFRSDKTDVNASVA